MCRAGGGFLAFRVEGSSRDPVALAILNAPSSADRRSFKIFPPTGSGAFTTENFEDDDESEAYQAGGYGGWRITVEADEKLVSVHVQNFGAFTEFSPEAGLIFPEPETRKVSITRS